MRVRGGTFGRFRPDFDRLSWSPDGTRIASSGGGEIHVVDVATGESSHVADGNMAEWLDDHTLVVSTG